MGTSKPSSPCSGIQVLVSVGIVQLIFSNVNKSVLEVLWCDAEVGRPARRSSGVKLSGGFLEVLQFGFIVGLESSWETGNKFDSDMRYA